MLTELIWLAALATGASDDVASRFELNVPAEVTLVGLTYGTRPELLVRFGGPSSVSRLRVAAGIFGGAEQIFVPFSLGYRAVFRPEKRVQPLLGVGLEVQLRGVSDYRLVRQFGAYLETGLGIMLDRHWSIGAMFTFDLMIFGGPGFGFGPRVHAGYRF